jgi:hypothetical protein
MDFLDQSEEVVAWLGFRLVRNPFVMSESLDYVMAERLEESSTRSLGYFIKKLRLDQEWLLHRTKAKSRSTKSSYSNTALKSSPKGPIKSIQKPTINGTFHPNTGLFALSDHQKPRWNRDHAPSALVRPLISILPEDDPVHGTRLANAQWVLLEEESLYGRYKAIKIAGKYLEIVLSRQKEEQQTQEEEKKIKLNKDHVTFLSNITKQNKKKKKKR